MQPIARIFPEISIISTRSHDTIAVERAGAPSRGPGSFAPAHLDHPSDLSPENTASPTRNSGTKTPAKAGR